MEAKPGDVYLADLGGREPHRVVVVSLEKFNRGGYVTVVPITSRRFSARSKLSNCVPFRSGTYGFTRDCVAQCEAITNLHVEYLVDDRPVDRLSDEAMRSITRAIGHVIGADCEPVILD